MELLLKQGTLCSSPEVAHLQAVILVRMRIVAVQPVLIPNLQGKVPEAGTMQSPRRGGKRLPRQNRPQASVHLVELLLAGIDSAAWLAKLCGGCTSCWLAPP